MDDGFVHLHVHSHYSLMWGASSVKELCRAARDQGFDALALTDSNGFYGIINFIEAAGECGLKPIVGAHLKTGKESAVVLVKTVPGYEALSQLISRVHLEEGFSLTDGFPEGQRDHLAVLAGDAGVLNALRDRAECYVEATPGTAGAEALRMARDLGLPPIATNAVYFTRPEDFELHRLLRAIDCNATLTSIPEGQTLAPGRWLKPAAHMANHFPQCPEALANAGRLARKCLSEWDHFKTVFPSYQDRSGDHFAHLLAECRKGVAWRYGESSEQIEARLSEELELIREKGFVDYFLVVADIVRRRKINCGRGSGAASIVSYLLGITHVDPIRHNLLFGRFLNPQRKDLPDIDVDFPWDERDGLLDEIRRCYGEERLAMVSNHVGFRGRAAVREVAKVYGIPAAEIQEMTRRVGSWTDPGRIGARMASHPKFQDFRVDPPWPEIIRLAGCLESVPRHLSTHCGGVVIVPDSVARHAPVQPSRKGVRIIQWEKDQAEDAGLVKIDLLGNRSLAVIRDALAAIEENTGERIDYAAFNPVDDPATLDLLKRGDTMGVFYVESPAMRQLQKKAGRSDFEHLVIHSSIIRPAANRFIREYIKRLHGEPYKPIHPRLEKLLAESYGIMVYQEDVIKVSMALAGFSWGEADGLRKIIGKKSPEKIGVFRERFLEGCASRGVTPDTASAVWEMILSFSGYSFCKPHSASYAMVSFKSAYLKAHHPAEFMAAVINNEGGYYCTQAYVSEARRMGIRVLGVDVNESGWKYEGKGRAIRMGFKQLQESSRKTLEALIEERERDGPFASVDDFTRRLPMSFNDAAILVKSGALDGISGGLNRPRMLWMLAARLQGGAGSRKASPAGQMRSLFPPARSPRTPPLPDLTQEQKWRQELEAVGFLFSVHPLQASAPALRKGIRVTAARDMEGFVGKRVWMLGWLITRKEVMTKEGDSMEFVSFEDETALYETVFFPKVYRRFCQIVTMNRGYLLYGRVESEFGAVSLNVEAVEMISSMG
jgi:error-prone DNA polymerase